jgi:beta-lactamase regulating signal transducer with metallopeptidase domain
MRASLLIFGVIFLVLGGLFYFVPMQQIKADTTTTGGGVTDTRTSSANITVPVEWAYAFAIIGIILFILGLAVPSPIRRIRDASKKDSYEKVVETKENIEVGDGNKRKIVRERTETHKGRKDDD